MILRSITGGAEIKVRSVKHSSLPLMPYKRQSIQSMLLTVYKVSAIMPLGAQVNREHQSTRTPEEKHQKWEVLQCHSHYCSLQVSGYKRLDYLSPSDKCDFVWDNHIVSGSTCKNVRSGWRAAAACWRDPSPLIPELHHLVSKFFPLREWLKRGSPAQPCWENFVTIVIPKDLLRASELCNR